MYYCVIRTIDTPGRRSPMGEDLLPAFGYQVYDVVEKRILGDIRVENKSFSQEFFPRISVFL
jgi:hypothetical protein